MMSRQSPPKTPQTTQDFPDFSRAPVPELPRSPPIALLNPYRTPPIAPRTFQSVPQAPQR